ncbi:MAG: CocE/NonD family hydrolase [Gemmatimonadetes bacterium]|nr:CocE/NonD family hydrolase [Gemmatimonadota bacterium]
MRSLIAPLAALAFVSASVQAVGAQRPADPRVDALFERREAMIPMRDGVKLFTVVLVPKRASAALPVLLSRTPYGTAGWGGTVNIAVAFKELIADGYVFVFQDIRGQHQSEGTFVMNRPPRDRRDPRSIDEATDTWDTIEWLFANVPQAAHKVGMLGISYPGYLVNAAMVEPHPALKAMSPQAPMVDTWMGDDFFHQGAFRQSYGIEWVHGREAKAAGTGPLRITRWDTYDWYRAFPTLDSLAAFTGAARWPTWQRFVEHPAYDAVWRDRAVDRYLTHTTIPTLTVGGFWDQEDGYGPQASFRALAKTDTAGLSRIVIGPWFHGEWYDEAGDSLGAIRFGRNTGDDFRALQARFFRRWLHDRVDGEIPVATVFDAGTNQWRTFDAWPPRAAAVRKLYLREHGTLAFEPGTAASGFTRFTSDPASPVPYRPRPIPSYVEWETWLVRDQRFVDGRPDVLTWQSASLERDLVIAGGVVARLFASTTGTDADWVVKLIDVYPDSGVDRAPMRGYELMIASDILRGRYREGFDVARPIKANAVLPYTVDLHQQAYTVKAGHRLMVQVQSTWFPLYDRNPQTFVPNIFRAKPGDYRAQEHRVHHSASAPSHLELSVLP